MSRIVELRDAVIADIRAHVPGLASVEAHRHGRLGGKEVKRLGVRTPGVRVGLGVVRPVELGADRVVRALVQVWTCAIAQGKDAEAVAWDIAAAIALRCEAANGWGLTRVGDPQSVIVAPAHDDDTEGAQAALVFTTWAQSLVLSGPPVPTAPPMSGPRLREHAPDGTREWPGPAQPEPWPQGEPVGNGSGWR